jgi:DNA-binding response OmpR family regulator
MMSEAKPVIAIIDDDPFIVKLLCQVLGETEFNTISINENDDIEGEIKKHGVDLVLLDLNLKNHYGFEIAKRLRERSNLGLIMLTGSKDQVDKLVGLEIGLDDYILKPFDNRELKARCRNVLRRIFASNSNTQSERDQLNKSSTEFNGISIDKNRLTLTNSEGETFKLTESEFKLFELFIERYEAVVTREDISQYVYQQEWSPQTRSVDVLVSKLRKKFNTFDTDIEITTARNKGYKLIGSK